MRVTHLVTSQMNHHVTWIGWHQAKAHITWIPLNEAFKFADQSLGGMEWLEVAQREKKGATNMKSCLTTSGNANYYKTRRRFPRSAYLPYPSQCNAILRNTILIIIEERSSIIPYCWRFTGISKIASVKVQFFFNTSVTYLLKYFCAKFCEILPSGSREKGVFLIKLFRIQLQFIEVLRMRCI